MRRRNEVNGNQGNTPRKFILSLIDLKLSRSDQQRFVLSILLSVVAFGRYSTSFSNRVKLILPRVEMRVQNVRQ